MSFIRKKTIHGNDYLYEQDTIYHHGRSHSKHVRYIGKASSLGLVPGSVVGTTVSSSARNALPYMNAAGVGLGIWMTGLFHFNRIYIKKNKEKIEKELTKKEIDDFKRLVKQRQPKMSDKQAEEYSKAELIKRKIEDQHETKKAKYQSDRSLPYEDTQMSPEYEKESLQILANQVKRKNKLNYEPTKAEMFNELRTRYPETSDRNNWEKLNAY